MLCRVGPPYFEPRGQLISIHMFTFTKPYLGVIAIYHMVYFVAKFALEPYPPTHPYRRKLRKEPFDRFLALCHVSLKKQQLKCSTVHVCL